MPETRGFAYLGEQASLALSRFAQYQDRGRPAVVQDRTGDFCNRTQLIIATHKRRSHSL
jgi:hypothetical protein